MDAAVFPYPGLERHSILTCNPPIAVQYLRHDTSGGFDLRIQPVSPKKKPLSSAQICPDRGAQSFNDLRHIDVV
jgi:hypothetical protein